MLYRGYDGSRSRFLTSGRARQTEVTPLPIGDRTSQLGPLRSYSTSRVFVPQEGTEINCASIG